VRSLFAKCECQVVSHLDVDLPGEQARQQQVAGASEVFNLTLKRAPMQSQGQQPRMDRIAPRVRMASNYQGNRIEGIGLDASTSASNRSITRAMISSCVVLFSSSR
jgi:hypothetical protein